jgi:hypothetical protein
MQDAGATARRDDALLGFSRQTRQRPVHSGLAVDYIGE